MAPREDLAPSTLGFKYPANRDSSSKCADVWLADKRADDGAEGLWRVGDNLYDLTDYMDSHPGGRMWQELTKGTDITEAFEVHHISERPEKMLPKFFIRKAKTKRHSPYTFKDDGFFRTLKRNVRKVLPTVEKASDKYRENLVADSLLIIAFVLGILACKFWSFFLAAVAAYALTCTVITGHTYFHRGDNFRMYYFDLSMMESREWRISHALSHHLLTNSIYDLEISLFEPVLEYLPTQKGTLKKYLSWFGSVLWWLILYHLNYIRRILPGLIKGKIDHLKKTDLIPLTLPLAMYLLGGQGIWSTLIMWNCVMVMASFHFGFVGLNAAHHHPDIFHDGDAVREDKDWGICQLDAVMDRKEINDSFFLALTNFGDHALHHLFPTMNHATLQKLYPTFQKTCQEFEVDLRLTSQLEMIRGQFMQLLRTQPNKNVTDLLKYSHK